MVQYNDALDTAVLFFKENGKQEITAIYECSDRWIFFGGIPGLVNYGNSSIFIMCILRPSTDGFAEQNGRDA